MLHSPVGTVDLILLTCKLNLYVRSDMRPNSVGSVPANWLEYRSPQYVQSLVTSWPVTSDVNPPTCDGIWPVMSLVEIASAVALVMLKSSLGIEPY